jgi:hypothetical protein
LFPKLLELDWARDYDGIYDFDSSFSDFPGCGVICLFLIVFITPAFSCFIIPAIAVLIYLLIVIVVVFRVVTQTLFCRIENFFQVILSLTGALEQQILDGF